MEFDIHQIIKINNIEVWVSNGSLNNWLTDPKVLSELQFKEVYRDWDLAAIFKGKKGWAVFILNGDEWSLAHCYIPDPQQKLTLKQVITVCKILKKKILEGEI